METERDQYFEAVQDAIEGLRTMNRLRPEMEWYYGPMVASLEWQLDNESSRIEIEAFLNGGNNGKA